MTPERVEELFSAISGTRVLVVGDLMLDRYVSGSVSRLSPEAPVPVVQVEDEWAAVGGAGNVAANVVALGAACSAVGCVGSDEAGRTLHELLEMLGISTEGIVHAADRRTTVKTRVTAQHHQIVRFDNEVVEDVGAELAAQIAAKVAQLVNDADVLVLQDYDKGALAPPVIAAALDAAMKRDIPSVADPKRRHFFAYQGVTLFKPNAKELEEALGEAIQPDGEPWMERTRVRVGCEHLLVTLGDRGVALKSRERDLVRAPTVAQSVYDVSGAGDTVTSVVAVVLATGGSPAEAAVLANHAAAVGIAKAGVATVSPDEIRRHVRDYDA